MTAPTLTPEEREFWRAVVLASMAPGVPRSHPCEEIADAAVRAYRERCAPTDDAPTEDRTGLESLARHIEDALAAPRPVGTAWMSKTVVEDILGRVRAMTRGSGPPDDHSDHSEPCARHAPVEPSGAPTDAAKGNP
jgi:hypothetical protein